MTKKIKVDKNSDNWEQELIARYVGELLRGTDAEGIELEYVAYLTTCILFDVHLDIFGKELTSELAQYTIDNFKRVHPEMLSMHPTNPKKH